MPTKGNPMPQIAALMVLALFLAFNSLAEASKHPRGSVYSATVEDGTPKVIHMKRSKVSKEEEVVTEEAAEEYLEDLVREQPQAKVVAKAPRLKAVRKRTEPARTEEPADDETLDSSSVSDEALGAEIIDTSALDRELKNLKKENASMKARLESLEAGSQSPKKSEAPAAEPAAQTEPPKAKEAGQTRTAAEKVPSEKVEELRLRARYAEKILNEFSLAYDYRTVTLKDFRRIYGKLKAAKAAQTQEALSAEN